MQRFAIYFTPAPESALAQAAANWLGRDIWGNTITPWPEIPGLEKGQAQLLLQAPRHYGFHATLKPPFFLRSGSCVTELEKRLEMHAATVAAFMLPTLRLTVMGHFLCLRVQEPPELRELAASLVRDFDDLRRPPAAQELEKRRAAGLSANQEAMLQAWGYPYVLDEYRFHFTLTGSITNQKERQLAASELERRFPVALLQELRFDALSLFMEEDSLPLRCLARYPLQQGF